MAITANKLLGKNGKGGPLAVRPKSNLVPFKGKGSDITKIEKKEESPLLVIKTKVIKIEDILKGTLAAEKRAADEKRKVQEQEERSENEEELENPDKKGKKSGIKIPLPGKVKGWWNNIKKFFFTVLFGWLALRVMKWLPRLKGILKFLASFADFVLKWGGRILAGLVTFVDWGYKAYDWTRDKIEGVFGEKGVQAFDAISGVLNKTMNLIFGLGLAMIALSNEWGNQGGDGTNRNRFKGVDVNLKKTNRRIKFQNADYLKRLKARYKQRFGQNIPDRFFKDLQVDQPRKPNFLDKAKSKFKGTNPLEDFAKRMRANQAKGLDMWGNPMKPNIGTQIGNWWESGSGWRQRTGTTIKKGVTDTVDAGVGAVKRGGTWLDNNLIKPVYRNTIGKIDEWFKANLDPGTILRNMSKGEGVLAEGSKRLLGILESPLLKKMFGAAPFIGDAIVFLIDLLSGKHWVRALLRTIGAFGVDWGFYTLMGMTALGAPFSGGTSLALSAAILAAYMAADAMAGAALGNDGVGQFLGDKMADWLGVPKKAGETGSGQWEKMFGSGGKINNSMGNVKKMIGNVKLTKKQELAISKVGGGLGDPNIFGGKNKKEILENQLAAAYKKKEKYIQSGDKDKLEGIEKKIAFYEKSLKGDNILPLDVNSVKKQTNNISVNGEGPGEVIVVRKSSSKLNNNENVTGGKVIAVDTGSGGNGVTSRDAQFYRGD